MGSLQGRRFCRHKSLASIQSCINHIHTNAISPHESSQHRHLVAVAQKAHDQKASAVCVPPSPRHRFYEPVYLCVCVCPICLLFIMVAKHYHRTSKCRRIVARTQRRNMFALLASSECMRHMRASSAPDDAPTKLGAQPMARTSGIGRQPGPGLDSFGAKRFWTVADGSVLTGYARCLTPG